MTVYGLHCRVVGHLSQSRYRVWHIKSHPFKIMGKKISTI